MANPSDSEEDTIHLPQSLASYSRPSPSQAAADAIPVLIDDTYHLFHLTTPPNTVHHPPRLRSSWSRLRSPDLVTWTRDARPVVEPSPEDSTATTTTTTTAAPDSSGAWTGCALNDVRSGLLHIFYTGYSLARNGQQVVLHKVASDRRGDSFLSSSEGPGEPIRIIKKSSSSSQQFEDIDFRDPYIFYNEDESKYWMLVATRLASGAPYASRGCVALLTSTDLSGGGEWEVDDNQGQGTLYSPDDMFCPECPELWTLGDGKKKKWYLVYSRFAAPDAGTVYRMADSPRGPFRTPRDGSGGRLDGRRWYAAKSCDMKMNMTRGQEEDERREKKRVFFGWIGDFCQDDGKWLWGGDLAVPREVKADPETGFLTTEIAEGVLDAIKGKGKQVLTQSVGLNGVGRTATEFPVLFDTLQDTNALIEVDIRRCDAVSFGLLLDADDDLQAHRLKFTPGVGRSWTVCLLADRIPLDDFWADQYQQYIPRSVDGPEIVRHNQVYMQSPIRILLRGPLLECFVGGRSISYRLPNDLATRENKDAGETNTTNRRRLGVFVEDGEAAIDVTLTII